MSVDVRSYLESKGLVLKSAGPEDVHTSCFFCNEEPGKRGRLYIHVSDDEQAGLFFCHLCGHKGNLVTLQRHFGDQVILQDETHHEKHLIWQEAAKYYADKLRPKHIAYLRDERGLTAETIMERQFGWADGNLWHHLLDKKYPVTSMISTGLVVDKDGKLQDFLHGEITIPYHVSGNVVLIRGKQIGGKYRTPPKQSGRLFNTDAVWHANEIYVCEGEFDALVLTQMGFNAVGCPGAAAWQDSWNGYFDDARRVYVCFDNDDAGKKGAAKVKDKLGPKVRAVELPPATDVSEFIVREHHTKEDWQALCREAQGGLLVSVDEAWDEWQSLQGLPGLQFGYEALDSSIYPGLLPGNVAIILAKTNTGKTIHLLNCFQRMSMVKPDVGILFVSLEQTRGDWFERARRIWNFYNLDCPPGDVHQRTLNYWRDRLLLVDKNRITEDELVGCIDDYEYRIGKKPDLVAVDYLGYWSASFQGRDRYEKVTNAVMSLKAVAKEKMIPVLTPHQVNRMAEHGTEPELDNARDSGAVEETADFVGLLWSPDTMKGRTVAEQTGEVNLKIGKSRSGGKGNVIKMKFAKTSLAMVPLEEPIRVRMAQAELDLAAAKIPWRHSIWRHAHGVYDLKTKVPSEFDLD